MKHSSSRHLYALFNASNPDLAEALRPKIAKHDLVAANIISSNSNLKPGLVITTVQNSRHSFQLDFHSRTYTSKGNWLWINQFDINISDNNILTLIINPRVIDIPYHGENICAFWFFKNFYSEIFEYIENYS